MRHLRVLSPGSSFRYGLARVEYGEDGSLEYCDPYGCSRVRVAEPRELYIDPVPPIHRPQSMTSCLYLEFSEPIVVGQRSRSIWGRAPFELVIHINGTVIGYVSPFRVKYTLVGGIVDGTICRYALARATLSLGELEPGEEAVIRIDASGVEGLIPGIGFNVAFTRFYLDSEGRVYYPVLVAKKEAHYVAARLSDEPPVEGLEEAWRASRRVRLAVSLPAFVTPLSMG